MKNKDTSEKSIDFKLKDPFLFPGQNRKLNQWIERMKKNANGPEPSIDNNDINSLEKYLYDSCKISKKIMGSYIKGVVYGGIIIGGGLLLDSPYTCAGVIFIPLAIKEYIKSKREDNKRGILDNKIKELLDKLSYSM